MISEADNETAVIAATRQWLERAVIGLNLCPFARAPHVRGQVRFVVSGATNIDALAEDLASELNFLAEADPRPGDQLGNRIRLHFHHRGDFVIAQALKFPQYENFPLPLRQTLVG